MVSMLDVFGRLGAANVDVEQNRCVRVRNRNAQCRECADACVSGCISYAGNQISIAAEKCIGCASCASACPTDALRPRKPSDAELHEACLKAGRNCDGRVVLACDELLARAGGLCDAGKVVGVSCLGRVDLSLLVRLVADGARSVTLVRGACDRCENARGIEVCERAAASADVLLSTWNSPASVKVSDKLPGYTRTVGNLGYDQGRRAFLASARDEAKDVAGAVADSAMRDALGDHDESLARLAHVDETGTLPHAVSPRRRVLLASLDVLAARYAGPQDEMVDAIAWSEVVIDPSLCRSCRMCATFCPTGANFKFEGSGVMGVGHRVRDCANCRLCRDICPTGALGYSEEVFAVDVAGGAVERFEMAAAGLPAGRDAILEKARERFKDGGAHVTLA